MAISTLENAALRKLLRDAAAAFEEKRQGPEPRLDTAHSRKGHTRQQRDRKGKACHAAATNKAAADAASAPAASAPDPPPRFGALPLRATNRQHPTVQRQQAAKPTAPAEQTTTPGVRSFNPAARQLHQSLPPSPPEPHELPTPSAALQTPADRAQRPGRRWSPQHLAAQVAALEAAFSPMSISPAAADVPSPSDSASPPAAETHCGPSASPPDCADLEERFPLAPLTTNCNRMDLDKGASAKSAAADGTSSEPSGNSQHQQQAKPSTPAAKAPAISPLPTACLDSQNWSPFGASRAADAEQRPPLQHSSTTSVTTATAAGHLHPDDAHGRVHDMATEAAAPAAQGTPEQQQKQQTPVPKLPPYAQRQQGVFRRFTWQRDAFAFADKCNLAAWGLTEADMVPLPEPSFTSVSVSGSSSGAVTAAKGSGDGDEVSSPIRPPGDPAAGRRSKRSRHAPEGADAAHPAAAAPAAAVDHPTAGASERQQAAAQAPQPCTRDPISEARSAGRLRPSAYSTAAYAGSPAADDTASGPPGAAATGQAQQQAVPLQQKPRVTPDAYRALLASLGPPQPPVADPSAANANSAQPQPLPMPPGAAQQQAAAARPAVKLQPAGGGGRKQQQRPGGVPEQQAPPREVPPHVLRSEPVRVFCEEAETEMGHARSFTAAALPALWQRYKALPPYARHFYEVVRERRPCHLYFDLEFVPAANPGADGAALVPRLLDLLEAALRQRWDIPLDRAAVVELDSSTPAKWSRHLVVRLAGCAFADNGHMGRFVDALLDAPEADVLMLRKSLPGDAAVQCTCLVDTAVYTRNRHFRLLWSCKGGKRAVLMPSDRFATGPGGAGEQLTAQELFRLSLATEVDPAARLLEVPAQRFKRVRARGGDGHAQVLGHLAGGAAGGDVKVVAKRDAADAEAADALPLAELTAAAQAVAPYLAQEQSRRAGGLAVHIRTIACCGASGTVSFSMLGPGSHWCGNVGRAHASNNVHYVVHLRDGRFAQKCHDPDCAGYRSPWVQLPAGLRLPPAVDATAAVGLPNLTARSDD